MFLTKEVVEEGNQHSMDECKDKNPERHDAYATKRRDVRSQERGERGCKMDAEPKYRE